MFCSCVLWLLGSAESGCLQEPDPNYTAFEHPPLGGSSKSEVRCYVRMPVQELRALAQKFSEMRIRNK